MNFLIFSLIILVGSFFYYIKNAKDSLNEGKVNQSSLSSQELDKIVNKYIKITNEEALRIKIMSEKSLLETKKKLTELERLSKIKQYKDDMNIPLARQIRQDSQTEVETIPADLINKNIYDISQQDKIDLADKKEYARQWIQNARKEGFLLELSADLEIIKYTPIRKPSQQDDSTDSLPSD